MKKICLYFIAFLMFGCFIGWTFVLAQGEDTQWSSSTSENNDVPPDTDETEAQKNAAKADNICMLWVGCKMDVSGMLGLRTDRDENERTSVLTFVQDAVLAVTMFIGTVVTLAFILSGLLLVFAGISANANLKTKAKQGMLYATIGMILVAASYVIIRLVQFIARG